MSASSELQPGDQLRHKDGTVVTLGYRKKPGDDTHGLPFHPGWWLMDAGGGLSDSVIDDPESDWTLLDE